LCLLLFTPVGRSHVRSMSGRVAPQLARWDTTVTHPTPANAHGASGPGARRPADDVRDALIRARLLVSSYSPLFLILAARIELSVWQIICVGLALLGIGDAIRLTRFAGERKAVPRTFVEVEDRGSQVAGYLATYLLPFLAAPSPTTGDLIGYAIYAVVVIVVALRSDLVHVNPTLYLLGWKVVTVRGGNDRLRYLVCKATPRVGEPVRVTDFAGVLHAENGATNARPQRVGRP
jgi:hypothetical protein